jgi:predicted nucleotidyltransferase
VLFGSIARGEASAASDIGLAVIAPNGWDRRVEMADAVRTRLGNDCDVASLGKDLTSAAWMSRALTSSAHVTPSTCAWASAGAV